MTTNGRAPSFPRDEQESGMSLRLKVALVAFVAGLLLVGCDENRAPQDPVTTPPAAVGMITS